MSYPRIIMDSMQTQTPSKTARFAHPPRNVAMLGIEPGMAVADFGAGSGAYVFLIAQALQGFGHIYALDIQRDLLRRINNEATRRGLRHVEVIWADLEQKGGSKIADQALDFVLVSNLLFQIENKHAMLHESFRILRPAGRLAIIDWQDSLRLGPQKKDVVTKDKALALAKSVGYEPYREFPAGAHHYGLILRKLRSH